jgi:hypothetical protein
MGNRWGYSNELRGEDLRKVLSFGSGDGKWLMTKRKRIVEGI